MLGYGNDERYFCFNGFLNRTGGLTSRNVYARCIWLKSFHGLQVWDLVTGLVSHIPGL